MALLKNFTESFESLQKKAGIKKWRIKGRKLAVQAQAILGTFYEEESYILIQTNKEEKVNLERRVHIWVGKNVSSEMEMNVLQMISSLDKYVSNIIQLTKQRQDEETRDFLDLFPKGIKYLHGAYDNYLHFQKGKYLKRLFQVKGKRNIKIKQVALHSDSLNHGDSFVLEDEWSMYIWNGNQSSKVERIKAIEVAQSIRDDLCYGKAEIYIADSGVDKASERTFFQVLGSQGRIQSMGEGGIDDKYDYSNDQIIKPNEKAAIFRIIENHAEIELLPEEHGQSLDKDILLPQHCYIVYVGKLVYIWCGHKCDQFISKRALTTTQRFIDDNELYEDTAIIYMIESYETKEFINLFDRWPIKTISIQDGRVSIKESENKLMDEIDGTKMLQQDMLDDATGTIKIWRIAGFDQIEWPMKYYGVFYECDSYIILYTNHDTQESIIYIWQGIMSSENERDNTMYYAQQLDDSIFHGQTTQVHVVFGDEPEHFLRLFKGKLTVLMEADSDEENIKFYQISGNNGLNTKTTQIPPLCAFLDSDDVFVLKLIDITMVWEGIFTSEAQKTYGEIAADEMSPNGDMLIFQEGYEPREFWLALGGRSDYNIDEKKIKEYHLPRLYHCSDKSGEFKVKEITPFDQDDLNNDDVMILDTNEEIYIWIGNGANTNEKSKAWDYVKDYLETDHRSFEEINIMQVKQGQEPNCFAYLFPKWDDEKAKDYIPYEVYKNLIVHENRESKVKELLKPTIRQSKTPRGEHRVLRRSLSANNADIGDKKHHLKRFSTYTGFLP